MQSPWLRFERRCDSGLPKAVATAEGSLVGVRAPVSATVVVDVNADKRLLKISSFAPDLKSLQWVYSLVDDACMNGMNE